MLIVQNTASPASIRNIVVDTLTSDVIELRVASAYVTVSGCRLLFDAVLNAIGPEAFAAIPKTLITCFDYGLTEPEALSLWSSLPNSQVYVAGAERLLRGSLTPSQAFHPKIYAFVRNGSHGSLVTGSANLTGRGWSINTETAWVTPVVPIAVLDASFSAVAYGTNLLTPELLQAYINLRHYQPASPAQRIEVEPVTTPVADVATDLPQFRLAIENNYVNPAAFSSMWVQGEALQGGSRNQLELPRGAHKFFGFQFNQYDYPDKMTIGQLTLRSGGRIWTDRLLAWHGNNRMERMNLPTITQGGFDYNDTAVMFRRLGGNSFELVVTPWNSDLARSWREASAQARTLFRLGTIATNRIVGLI